MRTMIYPSAVELNLLRRAKRQADYCDKHEVDYPTLDKWYRKTHKKVYPVTVKGIPSVEEAEIQTEAEKVSEEISVGKPPDVFRQMEVKN